MSKVNKGKGTKDSAVAPEDAASGTSEFEAYRDETSAYLRC
jgi:hypothetical protein